MTTRILSTMFTKCRSISLFYCVFRFLTCFGF